MTDIFRTSMRDEALGSLDREHVDRQVRLVGWVHRARDLGSLVFFDLRDRTGRVQVSFDPEWADEETLARARALGAEDVVRVEGTLAARPADAQREVGEFEVRATRLEVVSESEPPPIPVYRTPEEEAPAEERRLRYRYLDLRRPEIQQNFILRHRVGQSVRAFLSERGFLEIETPLLTKRTPEGARDYLVPSRVHPGEFYALPQSPQLYKQLLMVAGMDRYFQIARCLRDEDLRADRQPEFTQVDLEMSFAGTEDVLALFEGMVGQVWREVLDEELATPFPRMTHEEALRRFGTDKPDLRIDLEIVDLTDLLQEADFRVFQGTKGTTDRIRGMRIPGGAALSRREIDQLQEVAREGGALGVLWVKRTEEGFSGPFSRALTEGMDARFQEASGMEPGDLFVAVVGRFRDGQGEGPALEPALDLLRRHLGRAVPDLHRAGHGWLWVTDFPLLEWDPEAERWLASHHPFTMPHPDDRELVSAAAAGNDADVGRIRSLAYDAVYNGHEMASGSVRIHDSALQEEVFRVLGIGEEEAREKFGFLLESFRYGAPPHAGIALGFDRLVMLMAGAPSLRDVIAFPKTTAARALLERAPSEVPDAELDTLGLVRRRSRGDTDPPRH